MPVVINGRRLGVETNGTFTEHNTDPIYEGRLWSGSPKDAGAARAWNDMRQAAIHDGIPPGEFAPVGPNASARTLQAQRNFWYIYKRDGRPVAAYPGTSNHGWGLAVDVKTQRAAAWIIRHGAKYGFSHDEGLRVGEWWHMRYVGGYKPPRVATPLANLLPEERRWCREYDRLRHRTDDASVSRRHALRHMMEAERKKIWRVAQHDGWNKRHRRQRYQSMLARTS